MSGQKVQKSHSQLYKARTPPWKDIYRQRCFDRLKKSREKLQLRFRNLSDVTDGERGDSFIRDLMTQELQSMKTECRQTGNKHADLQEESLDATDIDELLEMFEDIQDDLRQEEIKMLEEYEQYEGSLRREEECLCSAIEKLFTDDVVCPVCQKQQLLQNKFVIFCACGMRVNTEQDCITLNHVKANLENSTKDHSVKCDAQPLFAVVTDYGCENLVMTCGVCDWMSIII